ncbi:16S rRNA (guanine(966)-N(2))-methyltransferase RsmD [Flintibacter muris]|uniref:16S rRNA (guanine(966)-N(2))-methyltransferase RsmD n=1 Tax=Flintibacter muris TaxID=2941327 RepID=UPI00203F44E9|nr:16S rRNA (guanine(966)-N(2))-methyltransferase RsmD [Flintibacter muris]
MRIITGSARGRKLKEPKGMDTRPTTDKVKEGLFNIIQFELEGRRVLDLFAGTGQLGLEALSRGAEHCTFVDQRREAAALVRENIRLCRFEDRARVAQEESLSFLSLCREKFDIVFLDPPYASGLLEKSLESLTRFDILREHGIIVCESGTDWSVPTLTPPYEAGREYRYGQIKLTVCRRAGSVSR